MMSIIFSSLACNESSNKPENKKANSSKQLIFNLTPEQTACVDEHPNLIAENIKQGVTISGVEGSAVFSYPPCSATLKTNCITSADFPAVVQAGLASKLLVGTSVGGVDGTAVAVYPDCSSDGGTACATTSTYKAASTSSLASKVISGQTVAGVSGSVTEESRAECSSDGDDSCITTATYPAADTTGLAAKVIIGNTVAGIAGSATAETHTECTGANQDSCIATSTYKTMDLNNKDASGAQDLNTSNFVTQIKTASTLEYWGQDGTRYTSDGDADISAENILENAEIFGVTGTAGAPPDCNSIGTSGTWVLVPGDPNYGTNDFCVMKYEAKNNGSNVPESEAAGTPWVNISQLDAITECASLGKGYHLITNDERMTIATNLAAVAGNWSSGTVGTGNLYRGHSDGSPNQACAADVDDSKAFVEGGDCTTFAESEGEDDETTQKRTLTLSNGNVVWDFAGNVLEWTSYYIDDDLPTPTGVVEYTTLTGSNTLAKTDLIPQIAITNSWNSVNGLGVFYGTSVGGGFHRGGAWNDGASAGLFYANPINTPSTEANVIGFRCVVALP